MTMSRLNASCSVKVQCPRCEGRPTVQSAVELRPGFQYLTLRCDVCGLVYDVQLAGRQLRSARSPEEPGMPSAREEYDREHEG